MGAQQYGILSVVGSSPIISTKFYRSILSIGRRLVLETRGLQDRTLLLRPIIAALADVVIADV